MNTYRSGGAKGNGAQGALLVAGGGVPFDSASRRCPQSVAAPVLHSSPRAGCLGSFGPSARETGARRSSPDNRAPTHSFPRAMSVLPPRFVAALHGTWAAGASALAVPFSSISWAKAEKAPSGATLFRLLGFFDAAFANEILEGTGCTVIKFQDVQKQQAVHDALAVLARAAG